MIRSEAAGMRELALAQRARSRELGLRTLQLHDRSRRLRRRVTGPIFAMVVPPEKSRAPTMPRVPSATPVGCGTTLGNGRGDGMVLELDEHGFILSCAHLYRSPTGHDPADMPGHHLALLYGEEQVADFRPQSHLASAVASGGLHVNGWLVRLNGERFWASMVLVPRFDDGGDVSGFVATVFEEADGAGEVAVTESPEIAARFEELHSEIIKRLFRTGLTLYGARSIATHPDVRSHLDEAVEGLDGIIRYIRRTLWELGGPAHDRADAVAPPGGHLPPVGSG
ncbi:MAG TPA: hypothetical protein VE991_13680 [Acidimicrobiales bacterium]|nr:hypothetical protein [Acidimicrobiales bacterium]